MKTILILLDMPSDLILFFIPMLDIDESIGKKALRRADLHGKATRNGGKGLVQYLLDIRLVLFGKVTRHDQKVAWAYARSVHRLFNASQLHQNMLKIWKASSSTALVKSSASLYLKAVRRSRDRCTLIEYSAYWRDGTLREAKNPVIYLKAATTLLQQSIAGVPLVKSTLELGALIRLAGSKIPAIIPSSERKAIRLKSKRHVQFWLSVLSFYRVFPLRGKASLETILHGSGLPSTFNYDGVDSSIIEFLGAWPGGWATSVVQGNGWFSLAEGRGKAFDNLDNPVPFIMEKSGPAISDLVNTGVAPLLQALTAWKEVPRWGPTVSPVWWELCRLWNQVADFQTDIDHFTMAWGPWRPLRSIVLDSKMVHPAGPGLSVLVDWYNLFFRPGDSTIPGQKLLHPGDPRMHQYSPNVNTSVDLDRFKADLPTLLEPAIPGTVPTTIVDLNLYVKVNKCILGKLALLPEAAGKVRVIAMVDGWTQWALAPVHNAVFRKLEHIDQDGTFDQTRALFRLKRWMTRNKVRYLASYDLSAATDCLPIQLQRAIIGVWLGKIPSDLWSDLLVGRGYYLSEFMANAYNLKSGFYRYGVGQPMGALSSWAMLALTHHFVVQLAALHVGARKEGQWFLGYALLGDDIQIADKLVGDEYLSIMRQLGVKVGLHKSLISYTGFGEFAKKFSSRDRGIYTMVPIKQLLVTKIDGHSLAAFAKEFSLTLPQILALRGKGHMARGALYRRYSKAPKWVKGLMMFNARPEWDNFGQVQKWLTSLSPSKLGYNPDKTYFREEIIKLAIKWHSQLLKLRTSISASPLYLPDQGDRNDFWDTVRAGLPHNPWVEHDYPPLMGKVVDPILRRLPMDWRTSTLPIVGNPATTLINERLYEKATKSRFLAIMRAEYDVITMLETLSTRPSISANKLIGLLMDLLSAKKEVHNTRTEAFWQVHRDYVVDREDFLGVLRLYNSTVGARSPAVGKWHPSLQDPVDLPSGEVLHYPLGRVLVGGSPKSRGLVRGDINIPPRQPGSTTPAELAWNDKLFSSQMHVFRDWDTTASSPESEPELDYDWTTGAPASVLKACFGNTKIAIGILERHGVEKTIVKDGSSFRPYKKS